jgi:hypothetical protein
MLVVTAARDGHVLDEVRLEAGRLTYSTGRAKTVVEGPRNKFPDLTDERLYELAAGWSNGYITISDEQDGPAEET